MEIQKYAVSETLARQAKEMNSFGEYKQGTVTSEYERAMTKFETAVNKLIEKNSRFTYPATAEQMELVEYYADKYAQKLAEAFNKYNEIRTRCPSVMIAGPANFPVRKKEKQNAAMDSFLDQNGELFEPTNNYYFNKIEAILTNKTIYSNDALALEKLQNKLDDLQYKHNEMKARNAYYRKNKTMKGYEGISDETAAKIDKSIENAFSWEKQPYSSYHLSNSNAEIKRIKTRIEEITKVKAEAEKPATDKYPQIEGVEVVENAEAMRIQLIFDGKPDEETREMLKSNGFRWSPRFSAWQRQLNSNGIWATKKVLEQLKNKVIE